jgi:hypothetical protein
MGLTREDEMPDLANSVFVQSTPAAAPVISPAPPGKRACTVRRCNVQVISLDDEAAELTNHGRSGHVPG